MRLPIRPRYVVVTAAARSAYAVAEPEERLPPPLAGVTSLARSRRRAHVHGDLTRAHEPELRARERLDVLVRFEVGEEALQLGVLFTQRADFSLEGALLPMQPRSASSRSCRNPICAPPSSSTA